MKPARTVLVAAALAAIAMAAPAGGADTDDIRILCSSGLKAVMEELVPQFEQSTKQKISITYDLASSLTKKIQAGEPFDVAVLTPPLMDELIKQGKIAPDSRAIVARSGLGLAARAGSRKMDVSTTERFRQALLDAKSITYAKEGASGVAFAALVERLGIAAALKPKTKLAGSGEEVGEAVARGDAELGVLPVSEILPVKGAELLATFPADVQSYIVMVAGASASARHAAPAREVIRFLMAPSALPVIKKKGMERAS